MPARSVRDAVAQTDMTASPGSAKLPAPRLSDAAAKRHGVGPYAPPAGPGPAVAGPPPPASG
eukprot:2717189-Alexandrium_andersonii.AAC.1